MFQSLILENFLKIEKTKFEFGKNLNVIYGENGTAKTSVLKLIYTIIKAHSNGVVLDSLIRSNFGILNESQLISHSSLNSTLNLKFQINDNQNFISIIKSKNESESDEVLSDIDVDNDLKNVLFIPTTDYLDYMNKNIIDILINNKIDNGIGYDLVTNLNKSTNQSTILQFKSDALNGKISLNENNEIILIRDDIEIPLAMLSDGERKIATFALLKANGTLDNCEYIIWDEPETFINNKNLRIIVQYICDLSLSGKQIFITSHNTFFLRELEILLSDKKYQGFDNRFFNFELTDNQVNIQQGKTANDMGIPKAFSEEYDQSDRYIKWQSSKEYDFY